MRIDKFLKVSRVIKRRTIADEACSNGRVFVNNKVVKSSYDIKIDDIVEVRFGDNILKFKVLSVKETVRKDEVSKMIEIL